MDEVKAEEIEEPQTESQKGNSIIPTTVSEHNLSQESLDIELMEEKNTWWKIVFLQFYELWIAALLISIAIYAGIVIYHLAFTDDYNTVQEEWGTQFPIVEYSFDTFFLIDLIFALIYKNWKNVRNTSVFTPRKFIFLVIDFVCFIPLDVGFILFYDYKKDATPIYILKCNRIMRLYRIVLYFSKTRYAMVQRKVFRLLIEGFTYLIGLAHTLTVLLYVLSCKEFTDPACNKSWIFSFQSNTQLYLRDAWSWYIVSLYMILGRLTCKAFSDIGSSMLLEKLIFLLCNVLYLLLMAGFFISHLNCAFIQEKRSTFIFSKRLHIIQQYLNSMNVRQDTYNKVMEFYYMFWKKRGGLKVRLYLYMLPRFFRKELSLDIYWDAFKHSHIFKHMNIAFLRYVSLHMKSEFLLRGQIIYNKNSVKNKMIYVVSGVIQILSDDDDETPLISFSGGTCLGEASLVFGYMNKNIVRCASYCEISILERKAFYSIMKEYPDMRKIFIKEIQERVIKGKELHNIANLLQKDLIDFIDKPLITPLRWLKDSLQKFGQQSSNRTNKSTRRDKVYNKDLSSFDDVQFTTLNLDMFVMSEKLELVTDAICLKTTWLWILQPDSLLVNIWDMFVISLVMIMALILPYYAGFVGKFPQSLIMSMYLCNLVYIIDLIIQVCTAFKTKDGLISDWKQILCLHLTEPSFIADIFSTVPFFLVVKLFKGSSEQVSALCALIQLIKMWKVVHMFNKLENSLTINISRIRLLKYLLFILFMVYFSSVLLYVQTCHNHSCNANGWVLHTINRKNNRGQDHYLVLSFYFATMLITGVGYDDVRPTNVEDILFVICLYILSVFSFFYMISGLSATEILTCRNRIRYQEMIKSLRQFMSENTVDVNIIKRVNEYFRTKWIYNQGVTIMFGHTILYDLPSDIHDEIQIDTLFELLTQVPLFQDVNEDFIFKVATVAKTKLLPSNEILTYTGEISKEMHILEKGYCEIVYSVSDGSQNVVMGPGSHFSVVEMCLKVPLVNTVRTITNCKIITIGYMDIINVLVLFPYIQMEFNEVTNHCMKLPQLIEFKDEKPSFDITDCDVKNTTNTKSWKSFGYIIAKGSPEEADYMNPFLKLKHLKFLRFFLLRSTIHPDGKFIKYWEICRVLFAFISAIIFPTFTLFDAQLKSNTFRNGKWVLATTAYVDIYLRLHCGYYNSEGLLVTHPLKTAVHYMTHAFFVDLLASFPLEIFTSYEQSIVYAFRLLQCYRIVIGAVLFETNVFRPSTVINLMKFLIYGIILVNAMCAVFVLNTCKLSTGSNQNVNSLYTHGIDCYNDSWIGQSKFKPPFSPIRVYLYGLYLASSILTRAGLEGISFKNDKEAVYIILMSVLAYIVTIYTYSSIIASRTSRNVDLTTYQEKMRSLVIFMKNKRIHHDLRNEVINYFELIWKRKRGQSAHNMFGGFHSALKEDALFNLFGKSLKKCIALKMAEKSVFRSLLLHAHLKVFLKGARIIMINDVHSSTYFVHKGNVVICGPDGNLLCTLGISSVFGNVDNTPTIRQGVTVIAKGHVEVLEISTDMFYKILSSYPRIKKKFQRLTALNTDYILSTDVLTETTMYIEGNTEFSSMDELKTNSSVLTTLRFIHQKSYKPNSKFVKIFDLSLIIGSVFNYFITVYQIPLQEYHIGFFIVVYSLDVLYLGKFYYKFHAAYEDEVGDIITDLHKIAQRYVTSRTGLYVDLLSFLPLDVIAISLGEYHWAVYLRLNRLIRLIFLFQYFRVTSNKLNINVFVMRFGFIAIWILIIVHAYACLLTLMVCWHNPDLCYSDTMTAVQKVEVYVDNLFHVTSMFTSSSSFGIIPQTDVIAVYNIIVILSSQIIFALYIGETCAGLEVLHYVMHNYGRKIGNMRKYLKIHDLSPALLNQVWSYVCVLWKNQHGNQFPKLLEEAPYYLREGIKNSLYGFHIRKSAIFSNCHSDFIRQLVTTLKQYTFYPGNYITFEGDIDGCMYFINSGEVEVITQGNNYAEDIRDILKDGEVFGVVQGLYLRKMHNFTYRAKTTCVILVLNRSDWQYLLDYFPSTKAHIHKMATSSLLTKY